MDSLAVLGPQTVAFRSIDEVTQFAEQIALSVFVPKEFRGRPGDVMAAIMYGLELGISPMAALQNIAVINAKPSVYGDLLLGRCLAHHSTESITEATPEEIQKTGGAWCEAKRKGRGVIRRTFSKEDAQRAKLLGKDIWRAYPGRMLMFRARGFTLRDAYADVLKGITSREEAQDYIDVTPTPAAVGDAGHEAPPVIAPAEPSTANDQPEPAVAPPASAPAPQAAQPAAPPTRAPRRSRAEITSAAGRLLREKAPGSDATARQDRKDLIRACWGQDGWVKVEALPLSKMAEGLAKLEAIRKETPPPVEDAEDDVPFYDVPSTGGPSEAVASPPGATIAPTEVSAPLPEGDVLPGGDVNEQDGTPEPMEAPQVGSGGFVVWGEVETLKLWAEVHQVASLFGVLTRDLPVVDGHLQISPTQFVHVREAVMADAL